MSNQAKYLAGHLNKPLSSNGTTQTGRDRPRGKRADPDKRQVNATIDKSIKSTAIFYLAAEEENRPETPYKLEVGPLEHGNAPRSLSDLIEQLLAAWVKHKGGIIRKEYIIGKE